MPIESEGALRVEIQFARTRLAVVVVMVFLIAAVFELCTISLAAQTTARAKNNGKAPYNAFYIDLEGDEFIHHSSPASSATQLCNGGINPFTATGCTEQFSTADGGGFGMGFRPIRYLQIDPLHLVILSNFNGFGNRTSTFVCVSNCTGTNQTTTFSIGTSHGLVTIGARFVLPLMKERLLLSAGAGFAYLRAFEQASTTAQASCYSCLSTSGHGPTEIGEIMFFPSRHVGIGFHVRNVQISSSGLTADGIFSNSFFGTKYTDQFFLIGGSISFRGAERR